MNIHRSLCPSLCFAVCLAMLSACAPGQRGLRAREAGALAGGALGAGLGAIVGNQVGSSGAGVAIGSAFGALSGGLIGHAVDSQSDRLDVAEEQLGRQQREIDENRRLIAELQAKGADAYETNRGVVVNLPDVLFRFGKASLTPAARDTAHDIARVIAKTSRHVAVEGHTDSVGSSSYNRALSRDRAMSVADALRSRGVKSKRMVVRGFGEDRPMESNDTSEGRARNRRVEVVVEN
jgi:outer membrane protein OmpA-like peptidoglycan-associated protein